MKFNPTFPHKHSLYSILIFLTLILSCSKDSDLLNDALFNGDQLSVEDREKEETSSETEEEVEEESTAPVEEEVEETPVEAEDPNALQEGLESRTTSFPPTHDAHFQSGKVYNQHIIRLEEGHRTSYLKFDLGQIDSIGGVITEAKLQFTINSDDGDGTITVFKGEATDWTEHDLTEIPGSEIELGSLIKQYKIGATEEITLDAQHLIPQSETLIMDHLDGNDLAFASKEHPEGIGPKLVVTYDAPEGAEIIVPIETDGSVGEDEVSSEEESTVEEESSENLNENQAPMAVADGTPSSGTAPLEVAFKGSNSTDDSEIKSYEWDFKDGGSSNSKNPTYTFKDPGSYEVVLKVTDDEGLTDSDMVTITVNEEDNEAPKAVASATPTSGPAPLKVEFKGSDSSDDNGISSYKWEFKDGSTATNANPEHTFDEPGEYNVKLTVTDENGLTASKTIKITVQEEENEAPKAVASATPTSGVAPLEVQFKGSNSTDDKEIDSYAWDFKDGNTSTSKNPSHTFAEAGEYKVKLTVTDEEGLSHSKTVTVTVAEPAQNEPPKAVATGTPTSGEAPLEVQFKGSNSTDDDEIDSYHWDFKDGSSSTNKNPSHTFTDAGSYAVKLTVKDKEGLSDTKTVNITVNSSGNNGGGNNGNYPSNAVFASDYGFNSNDATEAFEAALNSGKSFIVIDKQNSDWVIKPTRIYDLRDATVVFESGVVLRSKSGAFSNTNDILLQLARARNVVVEGYGATFKMNKNEYNSGEHRHALSIAKGTNITIKGLTLRDSGGDGIHLAGLESGSYSQNITIEDVVATNNRRQGMTIVSAKDVWVRNSIFEKTNGTKPEAGVDLEPNHASERLVNINFINCKFRNNDAAGFMIAAGLMTSSSTPISVTVRDSEFSYNSKSPGSNIPTTEIRISAGTTTNTVRGEVRFERITFNGSNHSIIKTKKPADAFNVVFKDCTAKDVAKSGGDSPIELQATSHENTLGGFTFTNFYIEYNKNVPFMEIQANSSITLKNVNGSFTIKEPNDHPLKYTGSYNPSKNVNVNINYNHIN